MMLNRKIIIIVSAVLIILVFTVSAYINKDAGTVHAENVEIYQLGVETMVLGGEGSSMVGDYEDPIPEGPGVREIVLGYTCIGTEILFDEILPSFSKKWEEQTGEKVRFTTGWNMVGLDSVATSVMGKPVQVLILASHANGTTRGYSHTKWQKTKHKGTVYSYPYVFVVRKGNPLIIQTYADLARPEVQVVHVDPLGTHGGLSTVFAIFGASFKDSEAKKGRKDHAAAEELLTKVQEKAVTRFSGRLATALFAKGTGDVLITIEPYARLLAKNPDYELVVPPNTFITNLTAFQMKKNISKEDRELIDAFTDHLFTKESQEAFVRGGFRSSDPEIMANHPEFPPLPGAWGMDYLGEPTKMKKVLLLEKWLDIRNSLKPKHEKINKKQLRPEEMPDESSLPTRQMLPEGF